MVPEGLVDLHRERGEEETFSLADSVWRCHHRQAADGEETQEVQTTVSPFMSRWSPHSLFRVHPVIQSRDAGSIQLLLHNTNKKNCCCAHFPEMLMPSECCVQAADLPFLIKRCPQ